MILSGPEIRKQLVEGRILIESFDDAQVNPASYDLRLGRSVVMYEISGPPWLDCARAQATTQFEISDDFVLFPGRLYLMHTVERVRTDHFVPIVDGKSSIGRLGVFVHVTAGYGDPGFDGQYTLEVLATYPTVVYAGMRFAQIRFHTIQGDVELYDGNYCEEYSRGPQPSRVWKQFERKT
jgi:dCTP deaminase